MSDMPDRAPLRVTVSDVAAAAGVSRATATRALKGEGRFAAETRARILEISERLGYVPNTMAAELAAGRTGTVGLMLRDASNPAYGLLFSRLQDEADRRDLDLVTITIGADRGGTQQVTALHRLLGMRVAGLIVATGGVTNAQLEPFADQVPIIRAGRDATGERLHSIAYDEQAHGTLLAAHVQALGHRRVAVLDTDPAASFPEHVRARAMREHLESAGVEVTVVPVGARPTEGVDTALALASARRITAVLCPSDYRQLAVLRAARAAGIDVPGDLSVTGCDGILPGADLLGLTTVRIPVEDIARGTIEAMTHLLDADGDGVIRRSYAGPLVPGTTAATPA
ncbi:LacI family transcriptional regulator [Microbacterium sp. zg.Y1090]|uniref:LacI family DNA-binding transcriptional regulator n=1 Tax=Microbacterium TaxID=33882 RepID=UPI00214B8ED9|nr:MULTISPECIES: LacI family DNA-binding transcriptional regulator [unclassified Microbacterium]MCR2812672.1 LacI family transcriptional regulator [Microbacterium sp. zg.Y1084]MCR2817532.1 LacI family transcriptional regulator [Microbacterium sp. zg.Y1090]MDL5485826.1 LacI family DNA-binding transcriptional regulator [Microbacterium sp. zg-Y1211]WIM28986.1 LacI family DNA-binding transcriptional regulator [Microbacterium sp. zg-Y1090]